MNNISMNQALDIWSDLWQAYYGRNGYGGDTAEIYAYRVMAYDPVVAAGTFSKTGFDGTSTFKEHADTVYELAASALVHILTKFEVDAECRVEINGKKPIQWIGTERFDHRVHVKVIHEKN